MTKKSKSSLHSALKNGLHPNLISEALRQHHNLALRAENHNSYQDLFVDNKQVDLIRNSDWQVIYGRRGTGKTFLLNILKEECDKELTNFRVLTIYITAQDCTASPVGRDLPDKIRALGYFQVFIEALTEQLAQRVDSLIERKSLIEWFGDSYNRRVEKAETLILEILSLSQDGQSVRAFDEIKRTAKSEDEEISSLKNQAKFDLDLSKANVGFGIEKGNESKRTSTIIEEGMQIAVPRFASIRKCLIELLETMEIHHLNILIDEWSTLDPTGSTAIQPEFAEHLKRSFAGTAKISVKIATNRYQTRFSNRGAGTQYRGLEIGADLFTATNLDHALNNDEERLSFFSNLLFKRLTLKNEKLKRCFINNRTRQADEAFIYSIFRDERAFMELVNSADGILREFLLMFNEVSRKSDFLVSPTWDARFVRKIIWEKSISAKPDDVDYKSEADQLLYRCIRKVAQHTGGRLFLIPHEEWTSLQSALEELLEKRIIHDFPRNRLEEPIRNKYRSFLVQYGLWIDWQDTHSRMDTDRPIIDVPIINLESAIKYVIDTSLVDKESLTCKVCNATFHKETRSFVLKKLCPTCFEPAQGHAPI